MEPFFSVVIPTYNRARTIGPALESVRAQSFTDFECIVVDDGSSDVDALEDVVNALSDSRFRVVRRTNGGGSAARNTGSKAARGQYIAFLDSDDEFLPSKLEVCHAEISLLGKSPMLILYSQIIVDRGENRTWLKPARALLHDERMDEYLITKGGFIQTSTIVIDRSATLDVAFDEKLPFGQDTDYCIRLWAHGYKFHMLPEPLVIWNDTHSPSRVSNTRRHEKILDWTERNRTVLSDKSFYAYRGWHGAKAAFSSSPYLALKLYFSALTRGAFSPQLAARVAMQVFIPPSLYRAMANAVVRSLGRPKN